MLIIIFSIFFALSILVRSYTHIDNHDVSKSDLIKASIPALLALLCLTLRESYFALPEGAMAGVEYLNYRKILLWVFLLCMGYLLRAVIYGSVFLYRGRH